MIFCDIASFYAEKGGGVGTYHKNKLAFFARTTAHRYAIIAPSARQRIENMPGGTIYWVRGFRYDKNYYHLCDYFRLRQILKTLRPDVLEFGSPYLDYWIGVGAARKTGAIQTAIYHCDFPDTYVRPFLRRYFRPAENCVLNLCYRYVRIVYRRLAATLVTSDFVSVKLRRLGLGNLKYLPLGVESANFKPAQRDPLFREGIGAKGGEKILFYCGRYSGDKGIDLLLSALPLILEDAVIHVVLAGAGPAQKRIQEAAGRFKNLHDLGYISDRERLAKIYASADGFLSPGQQETFGLGIAEAVSSGLPVLSADGGAGVELVTRFQCGLLFKAGDRRDLARKAQQLVHSNFRPGIARARTYLSEHRNWDRVFLSYIEFHEKLKASQR